MQKLGLNVIVYSLTTIALFYVCFPFAWLMMTSVKPSSLIFRPDVLIFTPRMDSWIAVLFNSGVPGYALNSIIVGVVTVIISIGVGCPAAYSFSRFKTGGNKLRLVILSAEMIPPAILIVPLFLLAYKFRILDSIWALIAAHTTFIVPIITWFLIGFFEEVPKELEEQAMVDGLTRLKAFLWVVFPNIRPGLAAAAGFGFILSWNDTFYALMLTGGHSKTLPVAIAGYWTFRGVEISKMAVAMLLSVIPALTAMVFVQKHFIRGLGSQGIKG